MKLYKILKKGKIVESEIPGKYGGYKPRKIFGRLDCKSGMRMKKENRVFFHTLEDAVMEGYRPCGNCRPLDEKEFERIRHFVPQYSSLREFYRRDNHR
ncbi:MAG: Ada metal-binding domain-containing protein [archaeon]